MGGILTGIAEAVARGLARAQPLARAAVGGCGAVRVRRASSNEYGRILWAGPGGALTLIPYGSQSSDEMHDGVPKSPWQSTAKARRFGH